MISEINKNGKMELKFNPPFSIPRVNLVFLFTCPPRRNLLNLKGKLPELKQVQVWNHVVGPHQWQWHQMFNYTLLQATLMTWSSMTTSTHAMNETKDIKNSNRIKTMPFNTFSTPFSLCGLQWMPRCCWQLTPSLHVCQQEETFYMTPQRFLTNF